MTSATKIGCGVALGIAIVLLAGLSFMAKMSGSFAAEMEKAKADIEEAIVRLDIEDHQAVPDTYGSLDITGRIENDSGRDFIFIAVSFTLFDAADNVVGYATDEHTSFKQGQTWMFSASIPASILGQFDRYELDEITGY